MCCHQREKGNRGCCDPDGHEELRERLKKELKRRKLGAEFRVNKAGCLDQCELGPTVVIYPQQIWYGKVTLDDVDRIPTKPSSCADLPDLLIDDSLLNTKGGKKASS